jgi:glutamine amidotransferase
MNRTQVGIVDYDAGNIRSLTNALEHLGADVANVRCADDVADCTHLVLPGVGAFGYCAERLRASGMMPMLEDWALKQSRPFLGICVGMQLLATASDESPGVPGLGWLGGHVYRLPASGEIRIPHVGWNSVTFATAVGEVKAGDAGDFYFDHSFAYGMPERGMQIATCRHGDTFSAVVALENILAVQFHPEKSQAVGLRLIKGFLDR